MRDNHGGFQTFGSHCRKDDGLSKKTAAYEAMEGCLEKMEATMKARKS
jgi:hypothetical protein